MNGKFGVNAIRSHEMMWELAHKVRVSFNKSTVPRAK